MPDQEHLNIILKGVESWNRWRSENPEIKPDLSYSDLRMENVRKSGLFDIDDQCGEEFVNLNNVNFESVNLSGAKLEGVVLGEANLKETDLRFAKMKGARLHNANLERAHCFAADFQNTDLSETNLKGAYLPVTKLQYAHLTKADLRGADLHVADFHGANLWDADLRDCNLERANFEEAHVTGIKFTKSTLQCHFKAIRVSTCHGSQNFKSFAQDQDYIEELRSAGGKGRIAFWLWWLFADCGRSFIRWGAWSILFALGYSLAFVLMGETHFNLDHLQFSFSSMTYYSVVTFTTLGFGDIKPITKLASFVVMSEVILGYIMLGGLISIFANKVARRS